MKELGIKKHFAIEQEKQPENMPHLQLADCKPVVFFDASCPFCRKEIEHYKRLSGADGLNWIDITDSQDILAAYGLDYEAVMKRFHVLDSKGHWQTGAWGFAEIWSHLTIYRWLAASLRTLRLLPALDRGYVVFARWRYRRRCSRGVCDSSG